MEPEFETKEDDGKARGATRLLELFNGLER